MKMDFSEMRSHESNTGERPECFYIICYPSGDMSQLAVAIAQDFDVPDYKVASRFYFHTETDASCYASDLARKNGLKFEGGYLLD
jgi:hypothetical protein